ncbi:MAG: hypothetical protein E6G57_16585 [Actinobacteria bacterium]|nr:MAG: hypothetical protein E6G57_16585 [Actinomycetota bacterium]
MKIAALTQIDRTQARELWRKYQEHRAYQSPADAEIAAIYKRIANGHTVIRALEAIRLAGFNGEGLPRLAVARADTQVCYWHHRENGQCQFTDSRWMNRRSHISLKSRTITLDWPGAMAPVQQKGHWNYEATVPLVPVHIRPKRGLANYHILWEAEWTRRYPSDPYLLRRFGGDAWLVVAAWDLTDVERAVMSSQMRS